MNSTISCPSCQRILRVPEQLLGQAVKCPSCSHTFTAPENTMEEAPRRASPPPPREDYDEPRPSKRPARHDDYDDGDYEDRPRRRQRREDKPGKVQAIGLMILIGGILGLLVGLLYLIVGAFTCFCLVWPGIYYSIIFGILALAKGIQLLGDKAYKESPPHGIATMMIINIINGDVVNLILGILVLVFLNDEEVKGYFR